MTTKSVSAVSRRMLTPIFGGLLLVLAFAGSIAWQWQGRAHQTIDVGAPLDDIGTIDFHDPEQGDVSYRWSRPQSRLRLYAPPPGTPTRITLRMFAPPQADGPQRVALSANGQPLGEFAVEARPRLFQIVLDAPADAPLEIGLHSRSLKIAGDSRPLGVAIDSIALESLRAPTFTNLLRELWAAPFLPLGVLLLAGCALLLRLPAAWLGGLPALGMLALLAADGLYHDSRLLLAWYLALGAGVACAALAVAALMRRWPRILPRDDRRALWWIAAGFTITLLLTFTPTVRSDGIEYYAYLRSATIDGDLNFENDYHQTPFPSISDKFRLLPTGYYENLASVGPAIVWAPLYGVGHVVVSAGRSLGMPWQEDGYAAPYVVLAVFTSALAGLAIMLAGYRIARRWVGPPEATLAAITTLLGSNLLYYTMREGSFAHALSGLAATLYVLAWLRLEERPSVARWAVLGAAAGATALMYWIAALVLVLPAFTFARLALAALRAPARERATHLRQLVLGGAVAAVLLVAVFSPQMIAWKIIYGHFIAIPHGNDYIQPRGFQGWKLLFSHLYGLLPWTPAFFLGLIGLPLLWRHNRWLTLCLAIGFATYFGYNASLARWFGGGSFGLRRFTVLTPWFMLGMALLFGALKRWRTIAPAVPAALAVVWTSMLLVRYDLFLIPHVPEQIAALPAPYFFLSRDTLPFWALRGWLNNTYITQSLRGASPAELAAFAVLIGIMALSSYGLLALYQRLCRPTVASPPYTEPRRAGALARPQS